MESHDYVAGWIDTSIHEFLSTIHEPIASMSYALLTCLDSSRNVAAIMASSKHLSALKDHYLSIGTGALVKTKRLLAAERQGRLFFGFDEIWLFPRTEILPKPDQLTIVGPDRIKPTQIEQLAEWMQANGCCLGLGDGDGMNFCMRVRGVAKYVVSAFNNSRIEITESDRESA